MENFTLDATSELSFLSQVIGSVDATFSFVSFVVGSNMLNGIHPTYIGGGNQQKLIIFPIFPFRPLKRCLKKSPSSVFGSLNTFFVTEFLLTRLKGLENRDWMLSRTALRKAVISGVLDMPGLLELVAKIVGVWPLVVSSVKETARKDDGDSLVL